jgi:hypothetical protein
VWTELKAVYLMPAAFTGAMTPIALSIPPRTPADILLPLVVLLPLHLALIAYMRWLWRQPPERRYLDLSRGSVTFLWFTAYTLGAALSLCF